MSTRRRQQFVHGQMALMLAAVLGLALLDQLTMEVFFVVSLVGFLALIGLTSPVNVTPEWRGRIRWLVLLALLAFGVFAVGRIVAFLPDGLF